jgi:hypothetical protein
MHLAWRWYTGLGFDQEIPHHSTFSKNRHGRFQESKLFEQLFEQIVRQCVEVGLVQGQHLSVDGSFVEANAAKESRIPREQLAEAAQVHHYLQEVEKQNPVEEPVHEQDPRLGRITAWLPAKRAQIGDGCWPIFAVHKPCRLSTKLLIGSKPFLESNYR